MSFDTSQESYQSLRAIVAERTDRIVAWVGSGLSADVGLPNWKSLRDRLERALISKASSLEKKESTRLNNMAKTIHQLTDLWTAFELLRSHLGETTWKATIREALGSTPTKPTPEGYKKIWKLKVNGVLNLNLDRFATKAYFETCGGKSPIEFNGNQASNFTHVLRSPRQFICNLHGNIDDASSWILTKSELKSLLENEAYKTFINSCLTSKTIIFFGISIDDIAVGSYLEGLTKLGIDFGGHFWITERKDLDTDKFAERIGICVFRSKSAGVSEQTGRPFGVK